MKHESRMKGVLIGIDNKLYIRCECAKRTCVYKIDRILPPEVMVPLVQNFLTIEKIMRLADQHGILVQIEGNSLKQRHVTKGKLPTKGIII